MNKTKRILMIVTNVFEYKTEGLNRVALLEPLRWQECDASELIESP
jgi:hypothetical protein